MSRVCELTGKRAMVGNNVSHALNRTKRKFKVKPGEEAFFICRQKTSGSPSRFSTRGLEKTSIRKVLKAVIEEARAKRFI